MKNILFFLIAFLIVGCSKNSQFSTQTSCPSVLFSSEHKKYIGSSEKSINLDNIDYRAEINNYEFFKGCFKNNDYFEADLSILFLIQPNNTETINVNFPYYVALLDLKDNVIDIQYYNLQKLLKVDQNNKEFIETDVTTTVKIKIPFSDYEKNKTYILLGFMLDKEKLKILN